MDTNNDNDHAMFRAPAGGFGFSNSNSNRSQARTSNGMQMPNLTSRYMPPSPMFGGNALDYDTQYPHDAQYTDGFEQQGHANAFTQIDENVRHEGTPHAGALYNHSGHADQSFDYNDQFPLGSYLGEAHGNNDSAMLHQGSYGNIVTQHPAFDGQGPWRPGQHLQQHFSDRHPLGFAGAQEPNDWAATQSAQYAGNLENVGMANFVPGLHDFGGLSTPIRQGTVHGHPSATVSVAHSNFPTGGAYRPSKEDARSIQGALQNRRQYNPVTTRVGKPVSTPQRPKRSSTAAFMPSDARSAIAAQRERASTPAKRTPEPSTGYSQTAYQKPTGPPAFPARPTSDSLQASTTTPSISFEPEMITAAGPTSATSTISTKAAAKAVAATFHATSGPLTLSGNQFELAYDSVEAARPHVRRRLELKVMGDDLDQVKAYKGDWVRKIMRAVTKTDFLIADVQLANDKQAAWTDWQQFHATSVRQILELPNIAKEVEALAWVIFGAFTAVYEKGYVLTSGKANTKLKCSERLTEGIEVIQDYAVIRYDVLENLKADEFAVNPKSFVGAKVANLWVNHGKAMEKNAERLAAGKPAVKKRTAHALGHNSAAIKRRFNVDERGEMFPPKKQTTAQAAQAPAEAQDAEETPSDVEADAENLSEDGSEE